MPNVLGHAAVRNRRSGRRATILVRRCPVDRSRLPAGVHRHDLASRSRPLGRLTTWLVIGVRLILDGATRYG